MGHLDSRGRRRCRNVKNKLEILNQSGYEKYGIINNVGKQKLSEGQKSMALV